MPRSCSIEIYPRLHVTLIAMGATEYRSKGGIGFAIDSPCAQIFVEESSALSVTDTREFPLEAVELAKLRQIISTVTEEPLLIRVSGETPSHHGFGSSTAIRLAILEAIFHLTQRRITRPELIRASGRGGTSGIGITTYFDGGLVFDVGVKFRDAPMLPSSADEFTRALPLLLTQMPMPDWRVGVCIPSGIPIKTLEEEVLFFKHTCPIFDKSVYEILYNVVYGLVASARENDLRAFSTAVNNIQNCEWKAHERALYGGSLQKIDSVIRDAGAYCVGMSSLGPCLFFLADDVNETSKALKADYPQHTWITASCRNAGRHFLTK